MSFAHPAHHQTMWQGACRDAATDRLLKIYNVIDYIVCCQPQKALLRDSRSYFGTTLESDHRLLPRSWNSGRGVWLPLADGVSRYPWAQYDLRLRYHQEVLQMFLEEARLTVRRW